MTVPFAHRHNFKRLSQNDFSYVAREPTIHWPIIWNDWTKWAYARATRWNLFWGIFQNYTDVRLYSILHCYPSVPMTMFHIHMNIPPKRNSSLETFSFSFNLNTSIVLREVQFKRPVEILNQSTVWFILYDWYSICLKYESHDSCVSVKVPIFNSNNFRSVYFSQAPPRLSVLEMFYTV